MANLKDVKYDAFISYRHSEFDSFVVENLHKKLENFKLPKSVLKKVKNGRTRINRVFRDVDELPLADNLSEPINEALRNSDYLITVCTPRYPQSRWCMKEIETFLQTHNRDHILVVLAEDEPVNSFPEILTLEEVETVDEKGEKVIIRKELEPLAADTRGENKKEVLKAMDTAVIKLAAAMFGLEFDDLRQRQREQKMRRMAAVFGSIGAAVLGFAVFATSALIKISRQNEMINEQYAELQDSFAGTMANASRQLLQEGRRKDAVYAVRNVLPDNKEDGFNNSAFNALVSAMDIYKVSSRHSPVCVYDTDGWLIDYTVSFDGNYILTSDDDSFFVYNVSDASLVKKIDKRKTVGTFGMFEAAFCGEKGVLVCDNGEATYYSLEDQTSKSVDIDSESFLYSSDDGFVTLACFSDIVYAVDNYGEVMYTLDIKKALNCDDLWINCVSYSDGDVLIGFDTGDSCRVCLFDEYSGEVKYTARFDERYDISCVSDSGIIYVALTGMSESSAFSTDIYAIDSNTGRELWKHTSDNYKIEAAGTAVTDRYLMVCGMYDIQVLDRESGELLKEHTFSDMICSCWVDDNWFHFILEDGSVLYCDDESVTKISDFYTTAPSEDIDTAVFINGDLFCKFWMSNYIIRYSDMISPLATQAADTAAFQEYSEIEDTDIFDDEEYNVNKEMASFAIYSLDKKYLLVQFIDKVIKIIDTETKVCVNTLVGPDEDDLFDFRYNDLTECYIISGTRSYLLDDKFNIVCETGFITGRDGNDLILIDDDFVPQRIPWLSYDGMLRKADEYLGDYVPSDDIRERYGIALPANK